MLSSILLQPLCRREFETHSPEEWWLVLKGEQEFQSTYYRTVVRYQLFGNIPLSVVHKCLFSMQFPPVLFNDLDHERLSKSEDKTSLRLQSKWGKN